MLIWIRDLYDPGSGMEKSGSGIRYKHPESANTERYIQIEAKR
jgi:hypothetical protein